MISNNPTTTVAIACACAIQGMLGVLPVTAMAMEEPMPVAQSMMLSSVASKVDQSRFPSYVMQVGYQSQFDGSHVAVIKDKGAWNQLVSSLIRNGQPTFLKTGSFKDYGTSFFASKKLAVAYTDLGSSGYNPILMDVVETGSTLWMQYDLDINPDALYTCDMSGCLFVVELPASSAVTKVTLSPDAPPSATTPSTPQSGGTVTKNTAVTKKKISMNVRKSVSMTTLASVNLGAYPVDANGTKLTSAQLRGGTTTYSTSNPKVVTIDKNGKMTTKLPGKATITTRYSGNGTFASSSASTTVTVKKRTQGFTKCSAHDVTVRQAQAKKASVAVAPITPPKTVYAKGRVSYSKVSGRASVTVNKKTGKVVVRKGTPKGTYPIRVKVSNAADAYCAASSQVVSFRVIVK